MNRTTRTITVAALATTALIGITAPAANAGVKWLNPSASRTWG